MDEFSHIKKKLGFETPRTQGAGKSAAGFRRTSLSKPSTQDLEIEKEAQAVDKELLSLEKVAWKDKVQDGIATLTLAEFRTHFSSLVKDGAASGLIHSVVITPGFDNGVPLEKQLVFRFAWDEEAEQSEKPIKAFQKSELLKKGPSASGYYDLLEMAEQSTVALQTDKKELPVGYFKLFGKDEKITPPVRQEHFEEVSEPIEIKISWSNLLKPHILKEAYARAGEERPVVLYRNNTAVAIVRPDIEDDEGNIKTFTQSEFEHYSKDDPALLAIHLYAGSVRVLAKYSDEVMFALTAPPMQEPEPEEQISVLNSRKILNTKAVRSLFSNKEQSSFAVSHTTHITEEQKALGAQRYIAREMQVSSFDREIIGQAWGPKSNIAPKGQISHQRLRELWDDKAGVKAIIANGPVAVTKGPETLMFLTPPDFTPENP